MNEKNIVKTLFIGYKFINRLVKKIDKEVENKALNSFYVSDLVPDQNETKYVSKDLIGLTERKIMLINIKLIIEKIVSKAPKTFARVLIMRFIDGFPLSFIAERMNASTRTISRWISNALQYSIDEMKSMGFEPLKIFECLRSEKWLWGLYKNVSFTRIDAQHIAYLVNSMQTRRFG